MLDTLWQYAVAIAGHTLDFALETAPWLLLGLLIAGLLKAYIPDRVLHRWIGGRGFSAIGRAAVLGAPLPLCSCGVIPAAIGLRRQGASSGSTISFLVATPETGVDSVAVSYVLLGPFLTIVRPVAAVLSAVISGLSCQFIATRFAPYPGPVGGASPGAEQSCCDTTPAAAPAKDDTYLAQTATCQTPNQPAGDAKPASSCDQATGCCDASNAAPEASDVTQPMHTRLRLGFRYAANDLLDEIWLWMLVGLVAAGAVSAFLDPGTLQTWGSGLGAMLLMLVIGVPMYICATASTPLAAAMLLAGVSPGTVLVFLLAGPATNLATVGLVRRELGTPVMVTYLASMALTTIALGLATDAIVAGWQIDILAQKGAAAGFIPTWLAWGALVALVLVTIRPIRKRFL
jgi:uncharacterized membrane protein YraQ (UPF0718 family)